MLTCTLARRDGDLIDTLDENDMLQVVPQHILSLYCRWEEFLHDCLSFSRPSTMHGFAHTERVLLLALILGNDAGLDGQDLESLATAAVFHDTRRQDDGLDAGHGARAAKYYAEYCQGNESLTYDATVAAIMRFHDQADDKGKRELRDNAAKYHPQALMLFRLFKDADGLDRIRLGKKHFDPEYLRTPYAANLISFARDLFEHDSLLCNSLSLNAARLTYQIDAARAVVVGIGSGMSSASGYDFYRPTMLEAKVMAPFQKRYGFKSFFDGMNYLFSTPGQKWAYLAACATLIESLSVGEPYRYLKLLLSNTPYFILTTNVDSQVPRCFGAERVFTFQGDFSYLQCKQPCCDQLFDAHTIMAKLRESTSEEVVPEELVPRCPECGWPLVPWMRDDAFLAGERWQNQCSAYNNFIAAHRKEDKRVLYLELGVGEMTPGIITLPFWDMVARNPQARLFSVNLRGTSSPAQLGSRATSVKADLAKLLAVGWARISR